MNSRLKERLIGAAVLVALGVWLIPWLLDGPDQAREDTEASLSLPVQTESVPVRTQTIDLEGRRYATDTATREAPPEPSQDSAPPQAAPVVLAEPPSGATGATGATEASSSRAEPDPVATDTPAPRAEPAWVVQLGSFGEHDNARRLAERVATFGYKADVSTYHAGGRTMYRVRVGPGRSRNEAEAVASSLTAHGFVAQVVRSGH